MWFFQTGLLFFNAIRKGWFNYLDCDDTKSTKGTWPAKMHGVHCENLVKICLNKLNQLTLELTTDSSISQTLVNKGRQFIIVILLLTEYGSAPSSFSTKPLNAAVPCSCEGGQHSPAACPNPGVTDERMAKLINNFILLWPGLQLKRSWDVFYKPKSI